MKRFVAALACVAALASCAPNDEANVELRRALERSELKPRTFEIETQAATEAYAVQGAVADDFRFKMTLSSGGRRLIEYMVVDDGLALRLLDPSFGGRVANELGHPTVDAALREGRWVVDPAGAPALFQKSTGVGGARAVDPFRDSREALRLATNHMAEAREIKEFSLEDIAYRPQYDPWRYPDSEGREVRYDLIRPPLPKNESQTLGGTTDDIVSLAQFRKTSAFVHKGAVRTLCSMVDIAGHEDVQLLRQRGAKSNPFLADLIRTVERGDTAIPIVPRETVMTLRYPSSVDIELPTDAVRGKLDTFLAAFQQAVAGGVLKPKRVEPIEGCRRASETEDSEA